MENNHNDYYYSHHLHCYYHYFIITIISCYLLPSPYLFICLTDPVWHVELLALKADEATMEILLEILENSACTHTPTTPVPCMEIVPPCLKILRQLTEYSWSCRHRLSSKVSVYSTVVMCAVVCRHSVQVNYEAACLITLLLFDEVAPSTMARSAFSLPASLVKRYLLL